MKLQVNPHRFRISAKTHQRIRKARRSMSDAEYRKVCGIFYWRGTQRVLERTQNKMFKPCGFKVTWADQKMAKRKTSGVCGAFRSHPISVAEPGAEDIKGGSFNSFALNYDASGDEFRLWRIETR